MRFFFGLLVGFVLMGGGVAGYYWYQSSEDPCLLRCGEGTECLAAQCVASVEDDDSNKVKRKKKRRRRRRWRRRRRRSRRAANSNPNTAATDTASPEETLRTVSARDLKSVSKGPSLRKTDYIKMGGGGTTRELSTAEINAKVRRLDRGIVGCIDRARGEYDVSRGKVVVAFRIERSGRVAKVRVSAPRVLQRGGLFNCVAPKIRSLRFGSSARSLIMSYPYSLR